MFVCESNMIESTSNAVISVGLFIIVLSWLGRLAKNLAW